MNQYNLLTYGEQDMMNFYRHYQQHHPMITTTTNGISSPMQFQSQTHGLLVANPLLRATPRDNHHYQYPHNNAYARIDNAVANSASYDNGKQRCTKKRRLLTTCSGKKKSVQFSDTALVFNYQYVSEATTTTTGNNEETNNEEISTWYNKEEYETIKVTNLKIVQAFKQQQEGGGDKQMEDDDDMLCIRGLENFVSESLRQAKNQTIKLNIQSILTHQHIQRQQRGGLVDQESLRKISAVLSEKANKYALDLGSSDAAAVAAR